MSVLDVTGIRGLPLVGNRRFEQHHPARVETSGNLQSSVAVASGTRGRNVARSLGHNHQPSHERGGTRASETAYWAIPSQTRRCEQPSADSGRLTDQAPPCWRKSSSRGLGAGILPTGARRKCSKRRAPAVAVSVVHLFNLSKLAKVAKLELLGARVRPVARSKPKRRGYSDPIQTLFRRRSISCLMWSEIPSRPGNNASLWMSS